MIGMGHMLKGEANGKVSMMRVATALVVTSIMGIFIAHNIVSMVKGCPEFVSMGNQEAMLIALTLGAKAAQHFGEKRNGKKPAKTDAIPMDKTE